MPLNSNKQIAVIGTVGLPAKYGGFETLVEYITKELNTQFDFTVYCSAKKYPEQLDTYNNCKLKYINLDANGVQSIPYDIKSIVHALKYADVLLVLGVSGCVILPFIKRFSKKKIIVNIDGLEWKRQKWNRLAKFFLKFSEKCAVNHADAIIADNKVIQDYVLEEYNKNAHLIAYGGDHCVPEPISDATFVKFPFLKQDYAFKVCRIEPENNIEMILEAFSQQSNLSLVLVGNWENSVFGQKMKQQYSAFKNLQLLDPIYNQSILNQLRSNCKLYVHGHSAGGTNPSLVEAMSLELPIVSFDIQYNRETTKNQALYFNSADQLITILSKVEADKLKQMGLNMKTIANQDYKWSQIAQSYKKLLF